TAENEREAQYVVHLVRVIRTTGRHDQIIASSHSHFRTDFRIRVGASEHNRIRSHLFKLVGTQKIRARKANKYISSVDSVIQRALIGIVSEHRLVLVQIVATRVDHTLTVEHENVLRAHTAAD